MSRGSRSPKRHSSKSERRKRSRERDSTHHKSIRERNRDNRSLHEDYHRNNNDASSSRKHDTQRGIDAAKNRLKASLSTAITDLKVQEIVTVKNEEDRLDYFESFDRQKAIEKIEEDGFTPALFTSTNNIQNLIKSKGKKNEQIDSDNKVHDKAMFGALWTSKEIEKKILKEKLSIKEENNFVNDEKTNNISQFEDSIAHERLSVDPIVKQQKWLDIFRERRKLLIEGNL